MNKMNVARKINAAIWAVAAIVLMVSVYKAWSANFCPYLKLGSATKLLGSVDIYCS